MHTTLIQIKRFTLAAAAAAAILAACAPVPAPVLAPPALAPAIVEAPAEAHHPAPAAALGRQTEFRLAMRKLWEDHVMWTRLYIVSAAAGLPDAEATAGRLLQNQVDIGNAIKPFYGDEAGDALTALLNDHILIAAEVLAAARDGDTAAFDEANGRWYANAGDIAAFLSSANPDNWPEAAIQAEMHMHLDLTLQEAAARLSGDFAADIAAYDEVHNHILGMADALSAGIIAQFPDKFE